MPSVLIAGSDLIARAFDDNGYLPIPVKIGSRVLHVDLNITVFSIFVVVLTIGMFKIV
ncbi:hypothetical protein [Kineobactrum salinum]|uniref:DUF2905 domain-containing protein n=1 Tax=Kineobactrum salinum TaxID=2708301 RepID=A0A6C0TWD7_9GAMM|nr:hypothetical protein [Kineobactrum salinum]QIB64120.1 hypothetical protein G3T16_00500 [Kineobactrum salinum]